MATRINTPPSELYQQDLYTCSEAPADLLRAGSFAELDLEHMMEKIEDVGGASRRSGRNRIRGIIEPLLKLEQPRRRPGVDRRGAFADVSSRSRVVRNRRQSHPSDRPSTARTASPEARAQSEET